MRIFVKYQDENTSTIRTRVFFDWGPTLPFCEMLHEKHLYIDTEFTFL